MLAFAFTATLALATPPDIDGDGIASHVDCDDLDPSVAEVCGETGDSGVEDEDTAVTSYAVGCSTAPGAGWMGASLLPLLALGRRLGRSGRSAQ
jgi:hypothetical protein